MFAKLEELSGRVYAAFGGGAGFAGMLRILKICDTLCPVRIAMMSGAFPIP